MLRFIVRRMMVCVVVLFLLSIATFTLLRIMPGDDVVCPSFCSKEEREARRHEYGLDKPWFPVSPSEGTSAWWMLVLPAAAAGGYVAFRASRRPRLTIPRAD